MDGKGESNSDYGPLVASIDEGTTSTRFMVFSSKTEQIVASHQIRIHKEYPKPGWVEQDATKIIEAVISSIEETVKILQSKNINPADIVTVGITNQRETTLLWDKITGQPLTKAIVWMDNRTVKTIENLLNTKPDKCQDQLREKCGLPISPFFSALKYRWLIDNVPEVKKAIQENRCLFGTIDSWLIWNLTGGVNGGIHITDVTNASRTMLMNISTLEWDEDLLKFFDIDKKTLPRICSSSEIYGYFKCTSLKNIPISGCLGDQQAALIGQLCLEEGQAKCTYGTGCFLLHNTGPKKILSQNGLLTTVAFKFGKNPASYALEGSIAIAGATFSWLRDRINIIDDVKEIEKLAEEVSSTNDVYFVPAFQGLYAPYWDPNARGLICGLTMDTDRRHILRAALEAVGYQTRALMEAMSKDAKIEFKELKVDGGMVNNTLLIKLLADICNVEVVKQTMQESTAFGAAVAAAMADGINVWTVSDLKIERENFFPSISEAERNSKYSKWKKAVERSFGWSNQS
ncbi:glycerol kinase-like [Planococcus citri]|uniref:glycerol kinase-like n=1 Tax=Planococcus citri TaxID=170843 RepID=UPI0031F7ACE5